MLSPTGHSITVQSTPDFRNTTRPSNQKRSYGRSDSVLAAPTFESRDCSGYIPNVFYNSPNGAITEYSQLHTGV